MHRLSTGVLGLVPLLFVLGCSGASRPAAAPVPAPALAGSPVSLASVGAQIFADPSLSASGRQSCAGCHDPAFAFASPPPDAVAAGGADRRAAGFRNAPSLKYLASTPPFHFDADGTPVGGFNRDGRAASLADQARRPFLTAFEMANASPAEVGERLARAAYADDFRALFGAGIFADPAAAFERALQALAAFERTDPRFAPYSSKYDAFLAGTATLTDAELHGLALFNDPAKGNCAACHPSARGADGAAPLFTDYSYDTLGVPRNAAIPANADPAFHDLGLCGPFRTDLAARTDLCGAFKVPTLRNVAVTAPYFHNGRFATLGEVVGFYVRRDTRPDEWYPRGADGLVQRYDDLPAAYVANVNTTEVPYDRRPGDAPALSPAEIDDVVAFLGTLTDGYTP